VIPLLGQPTTEQSGRDAVTWDEIWEDRADWLPDLALGLAVLVVGLYEAATIHVLVQSRVPMALVVLGTAAAVSLSRRAPAVALALVWLTCSLQVLHNTPILLTQLSIGIVSFGTARWGRPVTVVLSALSIPTAGIVAVLFSGLDIFRRLISVAQYQTVLDVAHRFGNTWQIGAAVLGMAALGVPWLAGLTLRFSTNAAESRVSQLAAQDEAARAQHESEQAHEIARLRDEQARLARDVHDVVGHSLAVILAQAEAAQYLPDDPEKLKATMSTIATSARSSLQDVRQVLSTTKQATAPQNGLDTLIDGIRASGHRVDASEVGKAQPLPPELEVVAYRVLQEMLTNAITHGRRDQPVQVERAWPDPKLPNEPELRIEVRNTAGSPDDTGNLKRGGGNGLIGMRRRLEAVGGRLDVRRREEAAGITFTTTAWVPVRPR
jgi:signal transduction histidine kinase